jgi:hypothetical protein
MKSHKHWSQRTSQQRTQMYVDTSVFRDVTLCRWAIGSRNVKSNTMHRNVGNHSPRQQQASTAIRIACRWGGQSTFRNSWSVPSLKVKWDELTNDVSKLLIGPTFTCKLKRIVLSLDLWRRNRPVVRKLRRPDSSTRRVKTQEPRNILRHQRLPKDHLD